MQGEERGRLGAAEDKRCQGGRGNDGPGRAAGRCLPLPVPQEGFFRLQEGGAPARAHFSGISLGTVMIPVGAGEDGLLVGRSWGSVAPKRRPPWEAQELRPLRGEPGPSGAHPNCSRGHPPGLPRPGTPRAQ